MARNAAHLPDLSRDFLVDVVAVAAPDNLLDPALRAGAVVDQQPLAGGAWPR
jgi:hypothetical protein